MARIGISRYFLKADAVSGRNWQFPMSLRPFGQAAISHDRDPRLHGLSVRRPVNRPTRPRNALIVIITSINRHIDIAYFGPWLDPRIGGAWAKEAQMADGLSPKPPGPCKGRRSARQCDERYNLKRKFCCRVAAEAVIVDR